MSSSTNEGDESDDFDVNTVPMTFQPVVKDVGATIVQKMFRNLPVRFEKSGDQQFILFCSPSESLLCFKKLQMRCVGQYPLKVSFQEKPFSPSSVKAQKKVRIVGCGNSQEDNGLAVFTLNVNVITVRVVMLNSSLLGWFVTGVDVKNCFSARIA